MAVYIEMARSSYAKVRDAKAFETFCTVRQLVATSKEVDGETLYGFHQPANDYGIELIAQQDIQELAGLLADGWSISWHVVGYENLRYLVSYGWVVNSRGEYFELDLGARLAEAAFRMGRSTPNEY